MPESFHQIITVKTHTMLFKLTLTWGTKRYGFNWFWKPQYFRHHFSQAIPPRTITIIRWLRGEVEMGIFG